MGPPLAPMAPPDQGSGATLKTTTAEMSSTCGADERLSMPPPQHQHRHERKLSSSTSFSSPTSAFSYASSSASTNYLPASSSKLSCESIPYAGSGPDDDDLSSFSASTSSSFESFYHTEALDGDAAAAAADSTTEFLDFEPCTTTRPPAVQTMMPQKSRQRAEVAAGGEYDPKRLPSSMFRARPANPGEWSATSNESLFSIQLSSSAAELNARYAADELYYDAAGFARFPSLGRESSAAAGRSGGGLCVRHDCARCGSGNKTRKSVRFAATESVVVAGGGEGGGKRAHSVVVDVSTVETEETAAAAAAAVEAPAAGWCELGCCLGSSSSSSPAAAWWPRCCGCHGCGCHCKWWF